MACASFLVPQPLAARSTAEASGFKTILAMRHSLSYLDLDDTPEGYVAEEVTLELSPEYSYEHIRIAAGVLSTIRDMRIARLKGRAASLNLFSIDRKRIVNPEASHEYEFLVLGMHTKRGSLGRIDLRFSATVYNP